jgi:hypothetical protein
MAGPDLRIGDSDRDAAAAFLREHYAAGRLTFEEFNQRLDATFAATTQAQLSRITRDLPHVGVPAADRPLAAAGSGQQRSNHDRGSAPPRRPGALPAVIAVVAAVLAFGLLAPHLWLFPGRIAILVAVFALVRGLLRRVWRQGSGPRGSYPRSGFPRRGRYDSYRGGYQRGPWR